MGYSVEKGILALIAANFAHQKDGVQDNTRNQQAKENDTQNCQRHGAVIQNDPADVERNSQSDEQRAQGNKEGYRSASSVDVHLTGSISTKRGAYAGSNGRPSVRTKLGAATGPLFLRREEYARLN